jgi:hypothetical protein
MELELSEIRILESQIKLHKKLALKYAEENNEKGFEVQVKRIAEIEMALTVRRSWGQ